MCVQMLDIAPQVSETLFTFLNIFFFFFLTLFWTEYFLLIFTFSQLPPICCWASPVNFSFQSLYFSNLKFLFGSSFLICFSSAILYLLCVVSLLSFNYLNKHIWNSQFEVFVKSNVEPTWSQFPLTVFPDYGSHFPNSAFLSFLFSYSAVFGWKLNLWYAIVTADSFYFSELLSPF